MMAGSPRDRFDVFRLIAQAALYTRQACQSLEIYDAFVEKEMEKYRRTYPFMRDVSSREYWTFKVERRAELQRQELAVPVPTAEQFWQAAYDFDPHNSTASTGSDLSRMLTMRNLPDIPLGNLGGTAKLALIPGMGALPNTEKEQGLTELRYAATDSGAISYPDAHPSELEDDDFKVRASQDNRLRRFAALGWVIFVLPDGLWNKTGHVLVMDMDETRDRHPWFVLASEWPTDFEDANGDFTAYAPATVDRDDSTQPGVLPGGRNRTVVGKVVPMTQPRKVPILKRFGPHFNFLMEKPSGDRSYNPNPARGPDLAHVMEWYWDPVKEHEVCYYKDGKEYMRYDRSTKYYTYPSLREHRYSVAGEAGMYGIMAILPQAIPLAARFTSAQHAPLQRPLGSRWSESSSLQMSY